MKYKTRKKDPVDISKQNDIPASLPALTYLSHLYNLEKIRPFDGLKILAVQHLLGSTIPFFEMLEKGGVKPQDVYIVGKAYSSHPKVVKLLQAKGYNVTFDEVFDHIDNLPYDTTLEKHIISTAKNLLDNLGKKRGLIIDDGGKAIRLLHQLYPQLADRFTGVEQTSRGARLVSTIDLKCPIVNVARSDAKTINESPMIAKSMVDEFVTSLIRWDASGVFKAKGNNMLLLGYGYIGEQVAKKMKNYDFNVTVYDPDSNKLKKAMDDGYVTVSIRANAYDKAHIIVGASGTQVIPHEEYNALAKGTLLVNMASTDTEFSAWNLRPQGKIVDQCILPSDKQYLSTYMPLPWRSLYKIQLSQTYFYLANGGFPSDFSGKINPIPSEDIQLTSALLLGGAIQSTQARKPLFYDLDLDLQNNVISEYNRLKSVRTK
ncbi:MAG: NAD(P)-dependent oxidoreductase [bacterium]